MVPGVGVNMLRSITKPRTTTPVINSTLKIPPTHVLSVTVVLPLSSLTQLWRGSGFAPKLVTMDERGLACLPNFRPVGGTASGSCVPVRLVPSAGLHRLPGSLQGFTALCPTPPRFVRAADRPTRPGGGGQGGAGDVCRRAGGGAGGYAGAW